MSDPTISDEALAAAEKARERVYRNTACQSGDAIRAALAAGLAVEYAALADRIEAESRGPSYRAVERIVAIVRAAACGTP